MSKAKEVFFFHFMFVKTQFLFHLLKKCQQNYRFEVNRQITKKI